MKVAFYTLGCKVNQYETQAMREEFLKRGYTVCAPTQDCDIVVINSCTVTAESDRKTRQAVRHYRNLCKDAVIVLCGCMPQAFADQAASLEQADIITGNTNTLSVILMVEAFLKDKKRRVNINPHEKDETFCGLSITSFDQRTRAFLKIEDGCERYCTYCVIPKARGVVRSKSLSDIKAETEALCKNGFSEIVLVGINLSAYGKGNNINLCDAVDTVCAVDGIKRVRLGSLEPDHISDQMLLRLSAQEKFCPQFHLSLQSGCDATLKRMNRHYDTAFYSDLVNRINKVFENAAITTDIMVGFAGETDQEFLQSVEFLKKTGFAKTHVFAYSRRKGTAAYSYKDQLDNKTKAYRSKIMITAAKQCEQNFLNRQKGKTLDVLFESFQDGYCYGYTKNYCRVKVKSKTAFCGEIKDVIITDVSDDCLIG